MLAPLGFSMINAKDGEEAVALTRSEHPDLILMDLRMPGKDGYQASKEIKASIEGKEIPIIALTASILELDKQHLAEFGMIDFLRKPFKENDLFILIEKYLGQIFEYSSETNAEKGKNKNQKLVLTSKIVSTIPIDLIKDLKQAVLSADFDQIMALIDQIEQSSPQIAGRLREMANDFQYDSLIHLLEEGRDHGN
jgi:CheY-like chemotaxis protein